MSRGRTGRGLAEWVEEVQACIFLFDHPEGEAREEMKFRSRTERGDPAKMISVLQELYGCTDSDVALQEAAVLF